MTVDAGKRLVGQVLEVRHRLPRIWRRIVKGELAWWRAGRIAQHTMHLPKAGAALVDGRLAATAHKVGVAHTEKLCQEALDHYDPVEAEARRIAAAENREVDVYLADAGRDGTVDVIATRPTPPTPSTSTPPSPKPPHNSQPTGPPTRWTSAGHKRSA